jgi:hypothetical protein
MRWEAHPREKYLQWHRHFALWPQRIDHTWVWLEWIERRGEWHTTSKSGQPYYAWKYRFNTVERLKGIRWDDGR